MTAFSIGFSTALSAETAAAELAHGVLEAFGGEAPAGGLLWATAAAGMDGFRIGHRLLERWPDAVLAGTSFEGLLLGGRAYRGEPAVGLISWTSGDRAPSPFLVESELFDPPGRHPGERPGESIARAILEETGRDGLADDDLLLLFPDAHGPGDAEIWLRALIARLGGTAVAGAAASGPGGGACPSWIFDERHPGALVGLLLPGAGGGGRPPIGSCGASRRASPWLQIDRCRGRWIDSLDGEPPADWIRRQLGLLPTDPIEPHLDRLLARLSAAPSDDDQGEPCETDPRDYGERFVVGLDAHSGAISLPVETRRGQRLAFALPDAAQARDRLRETLQGLPDSRALLQLACRSRDESLHGDLDLEHALVSSEVSTAATIGTLGPFQLGPGPGGVPSVLVHATVLVPLGEQL